MLAIKFPSADLSRYQRSIDNAAEEELLRYSMRMLTANTIDDVFKD
jgi:hypothetical protein